MGALHAQGLGLKMYYLHFVVSYKRLEAGTFRLAQQSRDGARQVEIDSAELALMLEGIELAGAKRRKRYVPPRIEN